MANFIAKPTNKEPVSKQSKNYEKNFNKTTTMHGLNLNEVDGLLTEKEMSLKKKIFSLPKMEALVHPDPKLSAVYNKMAEDGEEKYGYHYNETIMNIIFNDYVLNSPKYLQKYKMAVPKKKKRRDKSGIRQLQKAAEKKIQDSKKEDLKKKKKGGLDEDMGGIRVKFLVHPNDPDVFAYFPDENYDSGGEYKIGYSHIGQHSAVNPQYAAESRPATPEEYEELKNELEQHVGYTLDIIKPTQNPSAHGGKVIGSGKTEGQNSEDRKLKNTKVKLVTDVDDLDETTVTGGAGIGSADSRPSGNAGAYGFVGPFRRGDINRRPIFPGGTVIQESNYLVETDGFEKYYNMLNEMDDLNEKVESKKQQRFMGMVRGVQKGDIDPNDVGQKVRKTAKQMKPEDVKDFAGTKHDKLFERVSEQINKGADLEQTKAQAKKISKEEGVVQHVNQVSNNNYVVSDWYDADATVCSFENGMEMNENVNNMNEHHLTSDEDKVLYVINATSIVNPDMAFGKDAIPYAKAYFMSLGSEQIDSLYRTTERLLQEKGVDPMSININENSVNEHHLTNRKSQVDWMIAADEQIFNGKNVKYLNNFLNSKTVSDEDINRLYLKYENMARKMGIDPMAIGVNEETDQTMIGANTESMANKPRPEGEFGGGVPMGIKDSGGLRESEDDDDESYEKTLTSMDNDKQDPHKIDWKKVKSINTKSIQQDKFTNPIDGREMFENEIFDQINEELEAFSVHHNKLKSIAEDRKPSALVLRDRLGKENESNFKSDMQKSVTKDVTKMERDIMWKDQQTKVGDNPYKAGEDLEKAAIKATEGNALKNVGDSDGTKGEIPKRNLTTKEQEEVDLYRLGQQDLVYDNPPNEKFEERVKAGMGEEIYKKRQEKLKKRAERPFYNKEPQPNQDTAVNKVQFNKEKSGWNKREGLKESVLTGKYVNELNKRKLVDFRLSDVKIVESVNDMFKVDFTGMGNSVDSRGNVNEAVDNVISSHKFYTDGKTVVAIKNPVQKLNENEQKPKQVVSEEVNKMKHLLGYDPKKFVDAKRSKI